MGDWDLSAVVRSCKTAINNSSNNNNEEAPTNSNTSSATTPMPSLASLIANQENGPNSSFPNLMQSRTDGFQELHQFLVTFNPTNATTTTSGHGINPNPPPFPDFTARSIEHHYHHYHSYTSIGASTSGSFNRLHNQQQQQHQQQQPQPQPQPQEQKQRNSQPQVQVPRSSSSMASIQNTQSSQTPRSRKRKSLQKKMVCQVSADNLSADLWAWRKYGQKPIKGSPYPRNYYRCSSCKGCAARKQVERSLSDPGMFVITYTGEHRHAKPVHRNSLAGSTRNKNTQTLATMTLQTHNSSLLKNPETSTQPASLTSHHFVPTMSYQGGQNDDDDEDDSSRIRDEDSLAEDDRLLTGEGGSPSSENDEDEVLIPNSTAALSDTVFLDPTKLVR